MYFVHGLQPVVNQAVGPPSCCINGYFISTYHLRMWTGIYLVQICYVCYVCVVEFILKKIGVGAFQHPFSTSHLQYINKKKGKCKYKWNSNSNPNQNMNTNRTRTQKVVAYQHLSTILSAKIQQTAYLKEFLTQNGKKKEFRDI